MPSSVNEHCPCLYLYPHLVFHCLKFPQHLSRSFPWRPRSERLLNYPLFIDQIRGSDGSHDFLSIHGLFLQNIIKLQDFLFRIRQQRKWQFKFIGEFSVRSNCVLADSDHFRAFFHKLRIQFSKSAGLFVAPCCIIFAV